VNGMTATEFDDRYREQGDPWGYESSGYERAKYRQTLAACGPGPIDSALELGGSIGVFTTMLAPRCRTLTSIDFAPTAVSEARGRLRSHPNAHALLGTIPDAIPAGPFDLVVASEILYYLDDGALEATLDAVAGATQPGARVVAVHWRTPGPERPKDANGVHRALRACSWLRSVRNVQYPDYLLDLLERW
jgi:predicted TPR repeat methyltransferase